MRCEDELSPQDSGCRVWVSSSIYVPRLPCASNERFWTLIPERTPATQSTDLLRKRSIMANRQSPRSASPPISSLPSTTTMIRFRVRKFALSSYLKFADYLPVVPGSQELIDAPSCRIVRRCCLGLNSLINESYGSVTHQEIYSTSMAT